MELCHAILTCLGVKGVGNVASNDGDGLRQERARKGWNFCRAKEEGGSGNRVISTEVIKLRLAGE